MINKRTFFKILEVLLIFACLCGFWFLGYTVDRTHSSVLISVYILLFLGCYLLYLRRLSLKQILGLGLLFRIILIGATPLLSQDFFRFIWDGMLLSKGLSPYTSIPDILIQSNIFSNAFSQELYNGMGGLSAENHSNYPPLNQLGFYISYLIAGDSILGNIISIRFLLILADVGIFWLGIKLLGVFNLPKEKIAFYFLNPLVIIELTGNLHWEGFMIFFLLLGLYLIFRTQNLKWSSVAMAASIATKLIPLILLPILWRYLKPVKSLTFAFLCILFSVIFFFPFFINENNINNYLNTINLWFNRFEFNASIYYLIREIGYEIKGYNIIRQLGKVSPYIILGIIAAFSFIRKNKTPKMVVSGMLLVLSCYFFISTTIHPWYIITLVALSMFTHYTYPLIWSALAIFSYSAYGNSDFKENYLLIGIEYFIIYGVFLYELISRKSLLHHFK